jgi:glycosyltransferase involved in cell wall biosynthesis
MALPGIAIVTPSFNQASFLDRTIRSVLDQAYPSLEYVVLDGGSTDGSRPIIERYANRLLYWRSRPDAGQSAAINEGWSRTTAEILGWLNSDDVLLAGTLERIGTFFGAHPDADMVYGTAFALDSAGTTIGRFGDPFDRQRLGIAQLGIPQPSTFIRRSLVEQIGPLDPTLHYAMDLDLYIRASQRGTIAFLDEPLAAFTMHSASKTVAGRGRARQEAYAVCLRYARGPKRLEIWARRSLSWIYQGLPAYVRSALDARRRSPIRPIAGPP